MALWKWESQRAICVKIRFHFGHFLFSDTFLYMISMSSILSLPARSFTLFISFGQTSHCCLPQKVKFNAYVYTYTHINRKCGCSTVEIRYELIRTLEESFKLWLKFFFFYVRTFSTVFGVWHSSGSHGIYGLMRWDKSSFVIFRIARN